MSLTIEQLKFAREIGATHINRRNYCYRKDFCAYFDEKWNAGWESADCMDASTNFLRIDFSPLDDYYADKTVDIAATGGDVLPDAANDPEFNSVPDGYYQDDEEDKLKPLKPESTPLQYDPADVAFKRQPLPAADMVNHPPHYQTDGIECIDAIRASLGLDGFVAYCRGNAIKYSWRAGKKDETAQDLRKAAWYLNKAATELEKQQ